MKQLPLQEGRKVAFRQPTAESAESTWILAVIVRSLQEKNRYVSEQPQRRLANSPISYEVQDAEPQDNGEAGL